MNSDALKPSVAGPWLVYLKRGGEVQLVWRDRNGKELGVIGQPQQWMNHPALSPNERKVAVRGIENHSEDVWVHDCDRPSKTRLSMDRGYVSNPVWSPNGEVTYSVSVDGVIEIRQDGYLLDSGDHEM